jgi:signal peptidase I
MKVKNYARKNANDAVLMTYHEKDGIQPYMFRDAKTPQPYWAVWSQPKTKGLRSIGPLEDSYYVTGYLRFEDNSDNYKAWGGEENWEVKVPIYRMVDRKGKDLIKMDHAVTFDPSQRFIKRSDYKPGDINRYNSDKVKTFKRIVSRIYTYTRIYDPKNGRVPSDVNYEAMYPSYKVQLADFKKRQTKFMFNVFYKPLKNYYLKGRKYKREALVLGIRHSWGCFKYMPMYKNKEYSHKHNKHF